jgi:phosphoserine phosphatase
MKSVIISDLDMTLTRDSLMYAMVARHIDKGIVPARAQTARLEIRARYDRGELSYDEASLEALVTWASYLVGKKYDRLVDDARDFFAANPGIFYPYFSELRAAYRGSHDFYLVTANFDFLARAVCDVFSLEGYAAAELGSSGGICDGTVKKSLLAAADKGAEAQKILSRYDTTRSIGLGDTENDALMLAKVACPVCVNPSPGLGALARANGWIVAPPDGVLAAIAAA